MKTATCLSLVAALLILATTQRASSDATGDYIQTCKDRYSRCTDWARQGSCKSTNYAGYMKTNCPKSCNKCVRAPVTTCKDKHGSCRQWVKGGFCEDARYAASMRTYCRKSCKMCEYDGVVSRAIGDGIVDIKIEKPIVAQEIVEFNKLKGMALNSNSNQAHVVVFGNGKLIKKGDRATRTFAQVDVPVGEALLGRVVDALGNPIDGKGIIKGTERAILTTIKSEQNGPNDKDSLKLSVPACKDKHGSCRQWVKGGFCKITEYAGYMRTNCRKSCKMCALAPDTIPAPVTIGEGLAIDTMINMKRVSDQLDEKKKLYYIYVAVGQADYDVDRTVKKLTKADVLKDTIVISATASDARQYLAPHTAYAMAQFFRRNGRQAVVLYDGTSKQVAGSLNSALVKYKEVAGFAHFDYSLNADNQEMLDASAELTRLSKLGTFDLKAIPKHVCVMVSGMRGFLTKINLIHEQCEQAFLSHFKHSKLDPSERIPAFAASYKPKGLSS